MIKNNKGTIYDNDFMIVVFYIDYNMPYIHLGTVFYTHGPNLVLASIVGKW